MFTIDLMSRTPIYEQIYMKIIELIIRGELNENDQIPSVRNLAKETGVNPNTVSKAYQELERNGVIHSLPGRGSFISKPNEQILKEFIFNDFDNVVKEAIVNGVDSQQLKERIDIIERKQRGEKK
ncbi:MAG: GntR family transcriptional regulator [Ruminococcus sp.]|jgi:GntR family transcriptional regulator|nr:GntR family transcriptional regulator [Ruminococcus sp.]